MTDPLLAKEDVPKPSRNTGHNGGRKPKSLEAQEKALRERGRSALTEGQHNLLLAQIIDLLADGKGNKECFALIKEYYKDTINKDLSRSSYYEIVSRAKDLWLTNINLPSLEKYKKEKYLKSEQLEERIIEESTKDVVDQAKIIKDIWTYQDTLVGLNSENPSDTIIISINQDPKKTIKALEIPEEE